MGKPDKTDTKQSREKTNLEKQRFLDALRLETTGANVLLACKIAEVNRTWMYQCKSEDPDFSQAWDRAILNGRQTLRDMAYSVVYKRLADGDKTVAMFVLKAIEPEVWNQEKAESTKVEEHWHTPSPRFRKAMEDLYKRHNIEQTPTK